MPAIEVADANSDVAGSGTIMVGSTAIPERAGGTAQPADCTWQFTQRPSASDAARRHRNSGGNASAKPADSRSEWYRRWGYFRTNTWNWHSVAEQLRKRSGLHNRHPD
jgi:hypothetical protein